MIWGLLLLLSADSAHPGREDCDLEPGVCYGLEALLHCQLGPGLRFCFGIEEGEPPKQPKKYGVQLQIYAPCGEDAVKWAAPRLVNIFRLYTDPEMPVVGTIYKDCDARMPRIDAVTVDR